jgi:uncharacterized Tic20 family protein
MSESQVWTLLGSYEKSGRNSTFGLVYAVMIAIITFQSHDQRYNIGTSAIILLAGLFIAKKAAASASIVGIATAAYSLIWVVPIFNTSIFYHVDGTFVLVHGILSLGVAVGAFTYLKN